MSMTETIKLYDRDAYAIEFEADIISSEPKKTDDKQFDTSQKVDAEYLVKVLCGKAMWDVLEEVPVEVDGSKDWVS